jgi:hypothetical protein
MHAYRHGYYILKPFSFSVFICSDRYAAAANSDRVDGDLEQDFNKLRMALGEKS